MKLFEHEGKSLFADFGIPIPRGRTVDRLEEVLSAARDVAPEVVVKAQVHAGGRGKAGGVRLARNGEEAVALAGEIMGMDIQGCSVERLLLEEALDIEKEFYLSVILNAGKDNFMLMFSSFGGMDVEDLAHDPGKGIMCFEIEDLSSLHEYEIRNFLRESGLSGKTLSGVSSVAFRLCRCFRARDLTLAEINPLVITREGDILAADAKVEVDDNSLFRQKDLQALPPEVSDPFEKRAAEIGISYVQMDGDVGIIASGAGLAMNTMDILESKGARAANFLETGGGITRELIANSVELLFSNPAVKGVVVNLYGGVNPMLAAANGVVDGLRSHTRSIPIVVKLLGNQQEEAWRILDEARILTVKSVHTEKAVTMLLEKMEGGEDEL